MTKKAGQILLAIQHNRDTTVPMEKRQKDLEKRMQKKLKRKREKIGIHNTATSVSIPLCGAVIPEIIDGFTFALGNERYQKCIFTDRA